MFRLESLNRLGVACVAVVACHAGCASENPAHDVPAFSSEGGLIAETGSIAPSENQSTVQVADSGALEARQARSCDADTGPAPLQRAGCPADPPKGSDCTTESLVCLYEDGDAGASISAVAGSHRWSLSAGGKDLDCGTTIRAANDVVVVAGWFGEGIDFGNGPVFGPGRSFVAFFDDR